MWQGMTDDIAERLNVLGVDAAEIGGLIESEALRAFNYVIGACNIDCMPEILKPVCVDMACAAIIAAADCDGRLKLTEEGKLKSIKEGDVTLQFDTSLLSSEARELIRRLDFNDKSLLLSYRRLKW